MKRIAIIAALALILSSAEAAPKKYLSKTCWMVIYADGTGVNPTGLVEAGGVVWDNEQRSLTLLPCALFADGLEPKSA